MSPIRLIAMTACLMAGSTPVSEAQVFWIGGYGPGIYASRLQANGSMDKPQLVAEQPNPSFFALHPTLDVLYVVTETGRNDAKQSAALAAYRFDRKAYDQGQSPALERLSLEKVNGDVPCHVAIDREGQWAVVSNYTSGSVSLFPIRADGVLQPESHTVQHQGTGPNAARQKEPHAHCAAFDPTNRFVLVADLGIDRVMIYQIDSNTKKLVPGPQAYLEMPPGSGPRHIAFHPSGAFFFVINELAMTMSAATWNSETGQAEIVNTESTIPEGKAVPGGSTAEVLVHPSGRFVYGSNRGPNTIALFTIDPKTGRIRRIENFDTLGKIPRNFRIAPQGTFLIAENQESDSIYSFRIDTGTGFLKPTGFSISTPKPACIKFMER
ncbi:MAG: lactonase family protein [Pirellula sp.]|nr:lactonase family protein [Pirellula sp.]